MTDLPPAPYLPTSHPDVFESTPLAQAGWYDSGQHGGVVSALIGRAIERAPTLTPMETARLTVELVRVVPIVPLRVATRILREGKKIQLVEASLLDADDVELARGVGLRLRTEELELPETAAVPPLDLPLPEDSDPPDMEHFGLGEPGRLLYHRHAIEVRQVAGGFDHLGPGAMWLRMLSPLVAGEPVTALTRAVVAGDFVNGLSRLVDSWQYVFMNADLTIHLHRRPVGEWVGVDATSRYGPTGRGSAGGRLVDVSGEMGRSTQTLFIAPAG